jgi:hypothetical protein
MILLICKIQVENVEKDKARLVSETGTDGKFKVDSPLQGKENFFDRDDLSTYKAAIRMR